MRMVVVRACVCETVSQDHRVIAEQPATLARRLARSSMAPGEEGFEEPRFAHSLRPHPGPQACSAIGGAGALAEPVGRRCRAEHEPGARVPMGVAMSSVDFVFSVVGNPLSGASGNGG